MLTPEPLASRHGQELAVSMWLDLPTSGDHTEHVFEALRRCERQRCLTLTESLKDAFTRAEELDIHAKTRTRTTTLRLRPGCARPREHESAVQQLCNSTQRPSIPSRPSRTAEGVFEYTYKSCST